MPPHSKLQLSPPAPSARNTKDVKSLIGANILVQGRHQCLLFLNCDYVFVKCKGILQQISAPSLKFPCHSLWEIIGVFSFPFFACVSVFV